MRRGVLTVVLGLAIGGAVACSLGGEDTDVSADEVTTGDVAQVLKSTLVLETGCMAAKVGPKQLLLAARCVAGNAKLVAGASVSFSLASGTAVPAAPIPDGGADAAAGPGTARKTVTIAAVDIHPSYLAKCAERGACGFDTAAASQAKDIAVITLTEELTTITTVPVDLDTVGQSDPLVAIGSGCASLDAPAGAATASKTLAVPARLVNHRGSPYLTAPQLVSRLGAGYVVTPGTAWRASDGRLCATNIGAPLFRAGQPVVAGVTSNFTSYDPRVPVPVTVHHTRVDVGSKVGPWLGTLGVVTTKTCSDAPGGCAKRGYDGGAPGGELAASTTSATVRDAGPRDGGGDAGDDGGAKPTEAEEVALPDEETDETRPSNADPGDGADAGAKATENAAGCATAPWSSPLTGIVGLLGVGLAGAARRRRRR